MTRLSAKSRIGHRIMARKPKLLARDHKSVVTLECYWHVANCIRHVWVAGRPWQHLKRCALAACFLVLPPLTPIPPRRIPERPALGIEDEDLIDLRAKR
jgi:hypothetical protein